MTYLQTGYKLVLNIFGPNADSFWQLSLDVFGTWVEARYLGYEFCRYFLRKTELALKYMLGNETT